MKTLISLFILLFTMGCSQPENDATPDVDVQDTGSDNGNVTDVGNDGGACENIKGYSVDISIPCKKANAPDQDLGCWPCNNAQCSGLAAEGCYLSSDQKTIVITDSISEPDPFLEKGWSKCGSNITGAPEDWPLCK